jgi:hypothetical protein
MVTGEVDHTYGLGRQPRRGAALRGQMVLDNAGEWRFSVEPERLAVSYTMQAHGVRASSRYADIAHATERWVAACDDYRHPQTRSAVATIVRSLVS